MSNLLDLMSQHVFEEIGTFFHMVTLAKELELANHPLKILPLYNYIKQKCHELYQPLQELSVDERMVKSKAHNHFHQYVKKKPIKWGFPMLSHFWPQSGP